MISTVKSGIQANSRDIAVISNNIANANTNGFKKYQLNFADIYRNTSNEIPNSYRGAGSLSQDPRMLFTQGSLDITGMTLDIAVEGDGMFVLDSINNDQRLFSRAGSYVLNNIGKIEDSDGNTPLFFQPTGNPDVGNTLNDESVSNILGPIFVEPTRQFGERELNGVTLPNILTLRQLETEPNGKIFARYGEVEGKNTRILLGQVSLARFASLLGLQAEGRNTFTQTEDSGLANIGAPGIEPYGRITFGALERSNVDVTTELLALIKTQQAYQANARILQTSLEIGRELINN